MSIPTIGVTTFNLLEYTRECLRCLDEFIDLPCHIVVVDDGSTDGTVTWLTENFPKMDKIFKPKNQGLGQAWNSVFNYGFNQKKSDLTILLNNDLLIGPNFLNALTTFLKDNPKTGLISPQCVDPNNTGGNLYGMGSQQWHNWATSYIGKKNPPEEGAHFCCVGATRALYDTIGGFDPNYIYTAYDDTDYLARAVTSGFDARITHDSVAFHHGGITQTFITNFIDNTFQQRNKRYFEEKFGCSLDGYMCNRSIFWDISKQPATKHPLYG